jgi:hypothetical protein
MNSVLVIVEYKEQKEKMRNEEQEVYWIIIIFLL